MANISDVLNTNSTEFALQGAGPSAPFESTDAIPTTSDDTERLNMDNYAFPGRRSAPAAFNNGKASSFADSSSSMAGAAGMASSSGVAFDSGNSDNDSKDSESNGAGPSAPLTSTEGASTTKKSRKRPNADSDAKRLDIDSAVLSFNSIEEALGDGLMGRVPLNIQDDDVNMVKLSRNAKAWVKHCMEAFGRDYLAEPEDVSKQSSKQKEWFSRWQKDGHALVATTFEAKGMAHLEKSCWHLFDAVIKGHELGFVHTGDRWAPSRAKCSERLMMIRSNVKKYALVRLDVLRSLHIDDIAANPEAFVKRKLANCWNNESRSVRQAGKGSGKKRAASKSPSTGDKRARQGEDSG